MAPGAPWGVSDYRQTDRHYYLRCCEVEEALAHVDREQRGEIRYGGFLELLDFLRKTEGFTQAEIAECHHIPEPSRANSCNLLLSVRSVALPCRTLWTARSLRCTL